MWENSNAPQALTSYYGNTGCRVFKRGVLNWKKMPKNQHTQWKLLNFENWTNGEPQYFNVA